MNATNDRVTCCDAGARDDLMADRHDHLRAVLPRVRLLLVMVADAHGARHPELHRVLAVFARFADDLARHLFEEERAFAPWAGPPADPGGLAAGHDRAAAALDEMRGLTAGFTVPAGACDAHRVLMDALRDLDADVRRAVAAEDERWYHRPALVAA